MAAFGRSQSLQIDSMIGDELFIRGDDAFARFECAAHPASSGIEAAGEFHDHVHIRSQHGIGIFAPNDARGRPGYPLARNFAVENVSQLEALRFGFDEDARHGTAHGSKAKDSDAKMACGAGFGRGRGRCVGRRN